MKSVLLFCALLLLLFLHFFFFFIIFFWGPFLAGRGHFTSSAQIFRVGWLSRNDRHTNKINSKSIRFEIHTFLSTRKIFSFHASPKHTHAHKREKKRRKHRERETARARSRAAIKISTRENK